MIVALILLGTRQYAAAVGVVVGAVVSTGLLGRRMVALLPTIKLRQESRGGLPSPLRTALLFVAGSIFLPILGLILILLGPKLGGSFIVAMGAFALSSWAAIPFLLYAAFVQASSSIPESAQHDELESATGLQISDGNLAWRQPGGRVRNFEIVESGSLGTQGGHAPRSIALVGYDIKDIAGGRVGCYRIFILDGSGASLGRITLPGSQLGLSVLKRFQPTISEPGRSELREVCRTLGLGYSEETFDDAVQLNAAHPGAVRLAWFQSHPNLALISLVTVGTGVIMFAILLANS